jgi:pimeloyl-ACP methyl ester carboxylesterase
MNLLQLPSFTIATYMQGNPDAEKLALVLPGKLDTKDYAHMRSHVDFLAERGYLALSFDPAGTWESPGDISLYTLNNYLKTIDELIEHFGNKPTVVLGHSRGGGMASIAGTLNEKITHFISIMGGKYPSEPWVTLDDKPSRRDVPFTNPVQYVKIEMPHIFLEEKDIKDLSKEFASCIKPKLFFLGIKDDLVTPEEVMANYEQFPNPKELYKMNCGHDYRKYPERIVEVNKVIGEFLDKYQI